MNNQVKEPKKWDYLAIAASLEPEDKEALIEECIEKGLLKQCERCLSWLYHTEISRNRCQHCK